LPPQTPAVPTQTLVLPQTPAVPTQTPVLPQTPAVPTQTPVLPQTPAVPTQTLVLPQTPAVPTQTPVLPQTPAVPTQTPVLPQTPAVPTRTPVPPQLISSVIQHVPVNSYGPSPTSHSNGVIIIDNKHRDPNCANHNGAVCLHCSNRYYFGANNLCIPVNPMCKDYSHIGACTSCYPGYTINYPNCIISRRQDQNCKSYT
jgi:hypothetical protein